MSKPRKDKGVTRRARRLNVTAAVAFLLSAVIFLATGTEPPTCEPMADRWGTLHDRPSGYICVNGKWERSFALDRVEREIPSELLRELVEEYREEYGKSGLD